MAPESRARTGAGLAAPARRQKAEPAQALGSRRWRQRVEASGTPPHPQRQATVNVTKKNPQSNALPTHSAKSAPHERTGVPVAARRARGPLDPARRWDVLSACTNKWGSSVSFMENGAGWTFNCKVTLLFRRAVGPRQPFSSLCRAHPTRLNLPPQPAALKRSAIISAPQACGANTVGFHLRPSLQHRTRLRRNLRRTPGAEPASGGTCPSLRR